MASTASASATRTAAAAIDRVSPATHSPTLHTVSSCDSPPPSLPSMAPEPLLPLPFLHQPNNLTSVPVPIRTPRTTTTSSFSSSLQDPRDRLALASQFLSLNHPQPACRRTRRPPDEAVDRRKKAILERLYPVERERSAGARERDGTKERRRLALLRSAAKDQAVAMTKLSDAANLLLLVADHVAILLTCYGTGGGIIGTAAMDNHAMSPNCSTASSSDIAPEVDTDDHEHNYHRGERSHKIHEGKRCVVDDAYSDSDSFEGEGGIQGGGAGGAGGAGLAGLAGIAGRNSFCGSVVRRGRRRLSRSRSRSRSRRRCRKKTSIGNGAFCNFASDNEDAAVTRGGGGITEDEGSSGGTSGPFYVSNVPSSYRLRYLRKCWAQAAEAVAAGVDASTFVLKQMERMGQRELVVGLEGQGKRCMWLLELPGGLTVFFRTDYLYRMEATARAMRADTQQWYESVHKFAAKIRKEIGVCKKRVAAIDDRFCKERHVMLAREFGVGLPHNYAWHEQQNDDDIIDEMEGNDW